MIAFLMALAIPAYAALTGDLDGTVYDSTGAVVPDAKVTIRNLANGAIRTVMTNSEGQFSALQLDLGGYEVKAEKTGFSAGASRVEIRSGEKARINFSLKIGEVGEVVTVEDKAQILDVATAQVSSYLDSKTVVGLPTLTRNPVDFATLAPGTVPVSKDNPFLGSGSFNSNGSRGRGNNITVDNITATDVSTTGSSGIGTLSLDAVQEFKVITNNFNAEFGRNSGAQVQIITKSGTNDYHGSAYWFHQNNVLNARDYFDTTGEATPFKNNLWGFTAGGPIIKNHLFVFGHYEGEKTRGAGSSARATVMTPAQAAAIMNPTSLAIFNQLQVPTSASGTLDNAAPNAGDRYSWSLRVDNTFNDGKDSINVRYADSPSTSVSPGLTFIGTNLPNYGASGVNTPRVFHFGYTRTISTNVVNQFRAAFQRSIPSFPPVTSLDPNDFGPRIRISGLSFFGLSEILPQGRAQNVYTFTDTLSWSMGKHQWKFGGDVMYIRANSFFDANFRPLIIFGSVAAFQSGTPTSFSQRYGTSRRYNRSTDIFGFVQDDWRITQDLTLNLGVRLESSGGVSEAGDLLSNLNLSGTTPLGGGGTGPLGSIDLGGAAFERNYNWAPRVGFAWNPGQGKWVVRGGYGMAYDYIFLNPITNLRFSAPFITIASVAGTNITGANSYANLYAGTAQAQTDAAAAVGTFPATQRNFGALSPVEQDLKNPRNMQWNFGMQYQLLKDLVVKASYVGSHNDYLQTSVPINLISASARPAPATSAADETARLSQFQAAFAGLTGTATGPLNNRIDTRFNGVTQVQDAATSSFHSLQVDVIKSFSMGFNVSGNYTWGHSIDDASDVLGVLVNDTSGLQDPRDVKLNRGNSQFDVRHRFVGAFNWQIPFAKGLDGFAGRVLDGWGFTGIVDARTGLPASIFAGTRRGINDNILLGGTAGTVVRADGDVSQFQPVLPTETNNIPAIDPLTGANTRGVNTTATANNPNSSNFPLTQPFLGNAGTSARNALRLDNFSNIDLALLKNTKITERVNLQFRWEVFNLFNHPNFTGFINDLTSPIFGTYTSTGTDTRQMQAGLKITF